MATLSSDQVAAGVQPVGTTGNASVTVIGTYALAAALAAGDIVQLVKVPKNAYITEVLVAVPDLDTNGSPTITFTVGDQGDVDRFITSSTTGQAGGVVRLNALPSVSSSLIATGAGYRYTAEDTIDLTVGTGPATGATSGTIVCCVTYKFNKP